MSAIEDRAPTSTTARRRSEITVTQVMTGPVWRTYLRAMGPGLVTGASDDDPSGIATYSQAGAKYGFGFLWAALLTLPLMATVQEICDRTALATERDWANWPCSASAGSGGPSSASWWRR